MSEQEFCQVGDLLEYRCPRTGVVWQWRVLSVCLGAPRQESLVELSPIMADPGLDSNGVRVPTTWVPEVLTRSLTIVRQP